MHYYRCDLKFISVSQSKLWQCEQTKQKKKFREKTIESEIVIEQRIEWDCTKVLIVCVWSQTRLFFFFLFFWIYISKLNVRLYPSINDFFNRFYSKDYIFTNQTSNIQISSHWLYFFFTAKKRDKFEFLAKQTVKENWNSMCFGKAKWKKKFNLYDR